MGKKKGRPKKFKEETVAISVRIPKSKKEILKKAVRNFVENYMKGYANSFSSKELNLTKKAVIFWLDSHEDETNLIEMNDKWDMIKLFKKIEKWNGNSNNVIKKKNPITENSSN